MNGRVETLPDPAALAHRVADWMTSAALGSNGAEKLVVFDVRSMTPAFANGSVFSTLVTRALTSTCASGYSFVTSQQPPNR